MIQFFFEILGFIEDNLWAFVGFPIIVFLGLALSLSSRFVQIRRLPEAAANFFKFFAPTKEKSIGIHPLKAFFACLGGCIGIGNIVAVCSAVQIGGPGALFWIWITAILGMAMKYSEVYLGIRYRVQNTEKGYSGGPMYFLQRVFKTMWIPGAVAILLCIYGVEIYQFRIVTESLTENFALNYYFVAFSLLAFVVYAGSGGVKRVGEICSMIIPFFILIFLGMGAWVLFNNLSEIPAAFAAVFRSAFTGHAGVGGFVGSSLLLTISQGVRRGCYASDVGIGYAAVIHSESSSEIPERQSSLIFIDLFLDIFVVCTVSILLILVTGLWTDRSIPDALLVQTALAQYFPYMEYFMPLFILLLGYSTIIAYFCVGAKCAEFLSPAWGRKLFSVFAACFLMIFAFFESYQALMVMSLIQVLLLIFNSYGIWRLRKDVSFQIEKDRKEPVMTIDRSGIS